MNNQNNESNEIQVSNAGDMDYLWPQNHNHNQNMQFISEHTTNQNNSYLIQSSDQPNYDFVPFTTDLFQPEEIFQLDQPLRNDFSQINQHNNVSASSPTTLLDLGSGTIHKGNMKTENFWQHQQKNSENPILTNDDSNNSSFSSHYNTTPDKYIPMNNNINVQTNLNHTENIACDLNKLQFTNDMVICQSKDNDNYFTQLADGSCSKNSLPSPETLIYFNNEYKQHYQCDVNIGNEELNSNDHLKQRHNESDFYMRDKSPQNCNMFQTDPTVISTNNFSSNSTNYSQFGLCLQNSIDSIDLMNYDNVVYNKSYNTHNDSMYHIQQNFSQTYIPVTASN